ncbi:MAG: sulfite exporter TauE/SafE family protein [Chloroflexi bacterium]|nr:sulfite exporter TauE/SafE family protein [Chloroflexota bacterium]
MPPQLVLIIIGFLAGILAGMFGIGGGVVIVPALMGFLGFTLYQASGTSLAALLLPVGIFAVLEYHRKGFLRIRLAALVAVGIFVGSYFGSAFALSLDLITLQRLYGLFLLFIFWRFAEPLKWYREWRTRQSAAPNTADTPKSAAPEPQIGWYWILLVGLGAGVLAGMFGIGGGVVIVPALVSILRFDQKYAVGTSLAALLLPSGLPAVVNYYHAGDLDIGVAALVAAGLLFGALAGARIALGLPSVTVKRLYGVFLLFIAFRFMFPEIFLGPR